MIDARAQLEERTSTSREVYERSQEVLAQEVVSTVVMPYPLYIESARGSRVTDVDGNDYIDLTMGYGPHVLGHAPDPIIDAVKESVDGGLHWALRNPYQEQLARLLVEAAPCAEKAVFCNSGTEATMYAIRAARAYTGKSKIAMFDGSYHGAHDYVLVEADKDSPRDRPVSKPRGAGIPGETQSTVVMLPYRDRTAFDIIRENKDDLAVVMIEPAQSSNPRVDCGDFLQELREVCRESGVLFLMDEVITGFRLAYGGGQEFFDVTPDLATYGKALGGGMHIGAIAGSDEIMRVFSAPGEGEKDHPRVFAGGTFNGHPMTMIAGNAAVSHLRDHPEIYRYLAEQGNRLADEINQFCVAEEYPAQMLNALSMFHFRFQRSPIEGVRDLDDSHKEAEETFYLHLLNNGVLVPGIHLGFISAAHTPEDVDTVIGAFKESLSEVREQGLL